MKNFDIIVVIVALVSFIYNIYLCAKEKKADNRYKKIYKEAILKTRKTRKTRR